MINGSVTVSAVMNGSVTVVAVINGSVTVITVISDSIHNYSNDQWLLSQVLQ